MLHVTLIVAFILQYRLLECCYVHEFDWSTIYKSLDATVTVHKSLYCIIRHKIVHYNENCLQCHL